MATATWSPYDGIATALSTGLDALGNNNHALSAAIDNSTNKRFYADLELVLASVDLSAQTNPAVYIWVINYVDGANYEDGAAGTPGTNPARPPDAIIPLRAINGAQRAAKRLVSIPPSNFKILLQNKTGAALAANSNTLKYQTYAEAVA